MKISLAVRNYNRANQVGRAIRSAQNQVRLGYEIEIIVVDDASEDESIELLDSFGKEITVYSNPSNFGAGASSQRALEVSTGDFFMLVDSDDYLSPISTSALYLGLEANPNCSFAFGDLYRVDLNTTVRTIISLSSEENLLRHGAGVLFKTAALRDIGGFNSSLRNCEDTELFIRLRQAKHVGVHIPLPLYRYNIHGNNLSVTAEQRVTYERLTSGK